MLDDYLLIWIIDGLLKQPRSGRVSVLWELDPHGCVLTAQRTDGTLLFSYAIPTERLKEWLCKASSVLTAGEKPST